MSFIQIGNTSINLAHVLKVRRYWAQNKQTKAITSGARVQYADGKWDEFDGQEAYAAFNELDSEHNATIIAAAPGFLVVDAWFFDEAPSLENISRLPVIAWHVTRGCGRNWTHPVTLDEPAEYDSGRWAILQPDGTVTDPGSQTWPTLEDWIKDLAGPWEKWKANKVKATA